MNWTAIGEQQIVLHAATKSVKQKGDNLDDVNNVYS